MSSRSDTSCHLCGRYRPINKINIYRLNKCGHLFCRICLDAGTVGKISRCPIKKCKTFFDRPVTFARAPKLKRGQSSQFLYDDQEPELAQLVSQPTTSAPGPSSGAIPKDSNPGPSCSSKVSEQPSSNVFVIPKNYTDCCVHCGRIEGTNKAGELCLLKDCDHIVCLDCLKSVTSVVVNFCPLAYCRKVVMEIQSAKPSWREPLHENIFEVVKKKMKNAKLNTVAPIIRLPLVQPVPQEPLEHVPQQSLQQLFYHDLMIKEMLMEGTPQPVQPAQPVQPSQSSQPPTIRQMLNGRMAPWDGPVPNFIEMLQPLPGSLELVYAYTPPTDDDLPDSW